MMQSPLSGVGDPSATNETVLNPPQLINLFPVGVIAAELTRDTPPSALTPAELTFISNCAKKRIDDFTRGRACAHRAMNELGLGEVSILAGDKREPVWPFGIVGSITHTTGFAAAVVARQTEIESLGIDCEVVDAVGEDLWERICTPAEQARLKTLPEAQAQQQAALIFAAKEAFYKCQFPLTRQWVGFEEVSIEPAEAGHFRIIPQGPLPVAAGWVASLVGRFEFRERWVVTAVTALISS